MPTAFILLNSDLGSDQEIITKIKEMLAVEKGLKYEVQGVYGIYDIVVKIEADNADHLRSVITNKIRKIEKVQSTLTMMVIEEQEKL
ncbi:MAG: Lrp/AsnC ligand binding domain-containing protein [Candidatus Nitrosotenuis sp.]|nr:Lrp/AsnC ligand binding domain-containing protein [Candidatus Nitrosotenuis sp.]